MDLNKDLGNKDIINLLLNDDVGRNKYLAKFLKIISNDGCNRIFSLNGNWGSGKTIFVKKLELLVNYISTYKDGLERDYIYSNCLEGLDDEDFEQLELIFKSAKFEECVNIVSEKLINAVYFNAWEHDDEDDPILSIVYEIINRFHLTDNLNYLESNGIFEKINVIIKNVSSGKFDFSGAYNHEDLMNKIKRKIYLGDAVSSLLDSIIYENCNKLVIFIDELDRCNPEYAVKMLERIKHYFNHDKIIIVISTNILELANTISALYGEKFSSVKYLDKFFDVRLELPKVDIDQYVSTLSLKVTRDRSKWFSIIVNKFILYKKLDMREINRYLTAIRYFEKTGYKDRTIEFYRQNSILELLILPYTIGLYVTDIKEYENFINGNGWEMFSEFIRENEQILRMCRYNIYSSDYEPVEMSQVTNENVFDSMKELYELIFKETNENNYDMKKIGGLELNKNSFNDIYDSISLLGALSDFTSGEE